MKTSLFSNDVLGVARPKRLELPQWIQLQTKIQATETAAMADDPTVAAPLLTFYSWHVAVRDEGQLSGIEFSY